MLKLLHAAPSLPLATALVGAALVISWLLPTPVQASPVPVAAPPGVHGPVLPSR